MAWFPIIVAPPARSCTCCFDIMHMSSCHSHYNEPCPPCPQHGFANKYLDDGDVIDPRTGNSLLEYAEDQNVDTTDRFATQIRSRKP